MAVIETIIIALTCLAAGFAIGFLFARNGTEQAKQNANLQADLAASEEALKEYQQNVTSHFQESANLINELTEAYRQVHNHMASAASELTPATLEGPILKTLPEQDEIDAISTAPVSADIAAPLDYAPKSAAGGPGMLDESYGLEKPETDEDDGEYIPNTNKSA